MIVLSMMKRPMDFGGAWEIDFACEAKSVWEVWEGLVVVGASGG